MKLRAGHVSPAAILMVSLALSGLAWAQMGTPPAGRGMMQRDPAAILNRSLAAAGAPALNETQRQQLTSLVNDYRAAHPKGPLDTDFRAAKRDLEQAILARDEQGVDMAADALAAQINQHSTSRIRDLGKFQIQVLNILSDQQVNALRTQYGNSGLIRRLGALVGGWFHGGFGRGMQYGYRR